jgi:xylulokinase
VSFSLLDGWRSLAAERDAVPALSLIGGGARSELWAQMLASLLDITLHVHAHGAAGGALGAARLAWLADGGQEGEVCRVGEVARVFVPDAAEASLLLPRHERFRSLYAALRDQFGARRGAAQAPALAAAG